MRGASRRPSPEAAERDRGDHQALAQIAGEARRQAHVMAYSDAFWLVAMGLLISLPARFLLRRPSRGPGGAALAGAH